MNFEEFTLAMEIRKFSGEMQNRLVQKKKAGYSGWDDPSWTREQIIERLKISLEKGNMVDVANFAMFANLRGGSNE